VKVDDDSEATEDDERPVPLPDLPSSQDENQSYSSDTLLKHQPNSPGRPVTLSLQATSPSRPDGRPTRRAASLAAASMRGELPPGAFPRGHSSAAHLLSRKRLPVFRPKKEVSGDGVLAIDGASTAPQKRARTNSPGPDTNAFSPSPRAPPPFRRAIADADYGEYVPSGGSSGDDDDDDDDEDVPSGNDATGDDATTNPSGGHGAGAVGVSDEDNPAFPIVGERRRRGRPPRSPAPEEVDPVYCPRYDRAFTVTDIPEALRPSELTRVEDEDLTDTSEEGSSVDEGGGGGVAESEAEQKQARGRWRAEREAALERLRKEQEERIKGQGRLAGLPQPMRDIWAPAA